MQNNNISVFPTSDENGKMILQEVPPNKMRRREIHHFSVEKRIRLYDLLHCWCGAAISMDNDFVRFLNDHDNCPPAEVE